MNRVTYAAVVLLAIAGTAFWLGGCPEGTTTNDQNTIDEQSNDPSEAELDAAKAVATSTGSLAQAVNTAQSPTGAQDEIGQSSLEIPLGNQTYTFGQCPETTLTASNTGTLAFTVELDFGSGCHPLWSPEWTCSGTASGSFSQSTQMLSMEFENTSCGEATLTGDIEVSYSRSSTLVDIEGDWDLTYADSIGSIITDGTGTGNYNLSTYSTTIATFTGTVTDTVDSWNVSMNGIKTSFPTYERFMPYAGEMTVWGTTIRTMIIRFTEDSPVDGTVEISIDGMPFVEVRLYTY